MVNKNWLAQKGRDINDNEFTDYVSEAEVADGNFISFLISFFNHSI